MILVLFFSTLYLISFISVLLPLQPVSLVLQWCCWINPLCFASFHVCCLWLVSMCVKRQQKKKIAFFFQAKYSFALNMLYAAQDIWHKLLVSFWALSSGGWYVFPSYTYLTSLSQVPQDDWSGFSPLGKDDEIPCRRMRSGSYIKAMAEEDSGDSDCSPKPSPKVQARRASYLKATQPSLTEMTTLK